VQDRGEGIQHGADRNGQDLRCVIAVGDVQRVLIATFGVAPLRLVQKLNLSELPLKALLAMSAE